MDWNMIKDVGAWLASTGILGALIWYLQHKITRREDERDRKREAQAAEDLKRREKRQKEVDEREAKRQKELDERERKRQEEQDARDERRDNLLYNLMTSVDAALELSEATAKAVQRIPDAHCNGDMHAALAYVEDVKHKKKDFLNRSTIISTHEGEED